ncbi:MAG: TIGR04141 family sporadically distributed protein [Desulfarculus sp.]|nr:TIGR04141 family sporadically distributed protein [Pseudomonadota bacterium]MBU4575369.1 TIGR04141 family sporadically distributed protein [Pseudomonadota bacterium]MBU4599447.1 TIGR04141 family sporadically distributed protein [Pseudomonadota bacterium]MBV1715555.1 TIGR04141 family sporadically distributed protein [Desulfarculus sp.]MBV1740274.1 TIGR04141 family sporadically distributed protein [Desulfarculus sp.]
MPEYKDGSEGAYNTRVASELADQFHLLDVDLARLSGVRSGIEIADLYSIERDFIHVKHYAGSSVLSHLFAQGKISGELFQMEKEFRVILNEKLPSRFKLDSIEAHPERNKYGVVYAIIRDVDGPLDLPFFSKLNIKNSVRALEGLGFRVYKAKIEEERHYKMTRLIPAK